MTRREAPIPIRCRCGAVVRLLRHGDTLVKADEEPVPGGELLVNVDQVVGRLRPSSAGLAGMHGHLGFRTHCCPGGAR